MRKSIAEPDGAADFLLGDELRQQAAIVAGCVDRFAEGEMDPSGGSAVMRGARMGALGAPPARAEKLGRKLDGATPETVEALRFAINKAFAAGYLMAAEGGLSVGHEFVTGRSSEEIWLFWLPTCRTMLEDVGFPKQWARAVRSAGNDTLIHDLKELGLTRFLGGSKLGQLGMMYAQAGVHLRLAQTDAVDEEAFANSVRAGREMEEAKEEAGFVSKRMPRY
jgi:hypothetical protein